jgi:hypothetical protein
MKWDESILEMDVKIADQWQSYTQLSWQLGLGMRDNYWWLDSHGPLDLQHI